MADSKARAVKELAPYHLYFNRTLFSHGSFTETAKQREAGYVSSSSTDYVRPENQRAAALLREDFRNTTMADIERMAESWPWGTPEELTERVAREHGQPPTLDSVFMTWTGRSLDDDTEEENDDDND